MKFRWATLAAAAALSLGSAILPHSAAAQTPVAWSLSLPQGKTALTVGSKVLVTLTGKIDGGWHIYAPSQPAGGPVPAKITVKAGSLFAAADTVQEEAPDTRFDANFGINVETYENNALFGVPVKVTATKAGSDTLAVVVRYQACTESMCLPAKSQTVLLPVAVVAAK